MRQLSEEIELCHSTLEAKGENSRRVKGLDGNVFDVPADAEHKATSSSSPIAQPHMRAFRIVVRLFSTFFSTFAPAPLAKTLTKPNTLNLTKADLYLGNILSVTSNIICRFLMGIVCDKLGARRGLAFVMLFTCPFILGLAFVQDAAGFVTCRFFIGMGLASFVACQVVHAAVLQERGRCGECDRRRLGQPRRRYNDPSSRSSSSPSCRPPTVMRTSRGACA